MEDPRVTRTRAAVIEAATTLFLKQGYAGTTMDEIAAHAGITKRTVYNNFADKETLFTQIVTDVTAYAEEFARNLADEFTVEMRAEQLPARLHDLGRRFSLAVLRPEVIALRRLLIAESREFPGLARDYFERAPGRVLNALADGFEHLHDLGLLQIPDSRRAAEQFAYLVVAEPLDRALLTGATPARERALSCAREGVLTFLARYGHRR